MSFRITIFNELIKVHLRLYYNEIRPYLGASIGTVRVLSSKHLDVDGAEIFQP